MSSVRRGISHPLILIEPLEGRTLLAGDSIGVLIGGAAAKSAEFVDPNGTRAMVRVEGQGNATVTFDGNNLAQGPSPSGIAVSGSDVTLGSIALNGTGLSTVLHITTTGRTAVAVGGITSSSVMASILCPNVVVTGNITTGGWVHQLTLAGAQDGTISIGPTHINGGLVFDVGSLDDENLASDIRIDSLTTSQWVNSSGTSETISAPQILAIRARDGFAPNVTVSGISGARVSLQTFSAGAINGGTWSVNGNVHALNAGSIATGWNATVTGRIDGMNITHDADVNLTAADLGSVIVHGNLSDSTIDVTQPLTPVGYDLNSLFVGGGIENSLIRSAGSIDSFSALQMQDSALYVGLVTPELPSATSDFANTAEIRALTLRRSASASFEGSDIAAYQLGTINLGAVATANGGTSFGLGAASIHLLSLVDQTTRRNAQVTNIANNAAFNQLLVSRGIAPGDLIVNVV